MTKKDYELIAGCINRQIKCADIGNISTLEYLSKDLSDKLGEKNQKFNRTRFLEACGLK